MNRQDIIRMATAAGAVFDGSNWSIKADFDEDELCNFARLIAEDCAKLCEAIGVDRWALYKGRSPYTGHERGRADEYTGGESSGAHDCAEAIREAYKP